MSGWTDNVFNLDLHQNVSNGDKPPVLVIGYVITTGTVRPDWLQRQGRGILHIKQTGSGSALDIQLE